MYELRERGVSASLWILVSLMAAPATSSVVTLDSQERVIGVRLICSSYQDGVERAPDFGPFSTRAALACGDDHTAPPVTFAWAQASQSSVVLGPVVHAEGWAGAGGGAYGWGEAKSVYLIRFTVHEPCAVQLSGNAFVGPLPAEILFNGPDGIIWHSGRGSVHRPFTLPTQVLAPGSYTLHAQAVGAASRSAFTLDMTMDAPMVDVQPSTWTGMRLLYR